MAKQGLKALTFLLLFYKITASSLKFHIVFVTQSLFKNHRPHNTQNVQYSVMDESKMKTGALINFPGYLCP